LNASITGDLTITLLTIMRSMHDGFLVDAWEFFSSLRCGVLEVEAQPTGNVASLEVTVMLVNEPEKDQIRGSVTSRSGGWLAGCF